MRFLYQLLLFAVLLPLASCADPFYKHCVKKFIKNYRLQKNIKSLIHDMVENHYSNGFPTSTIVDGINSVYGLTSCRGDVSDEDCKACLTEAAKSIEESCLNSADSRIWYDRCLLRYNTAKFLGTVVTEDAKGRMAKTEPGDTTSFDDASLRKLLDWVTLVAMLAEKKFSMSKKSLNAGTEIYGMAQCTQDLGKAACKKCLEKMTSLMLTKCRNLAGCTYMSSSCALRYEIYNFFQTNFIPLYPGDEIN